MIRSKAIFILSFCLCLSACAANAQLYNRTWYFGGNAGIDFNQTPPVKLINSAMNTNEGCASISDPATGEILFYTNGDTVWNREHQPMPNGFGLGGHYSTSQAALIVPAPGNPQLFYVFTVYAQANEYINFCCGSGGLNLNVVDMTLDGGLGDVTVKNQLVLTPTAEKLTAVKHCNGVDYWVLTHEWDSDNFFAFPLTAAGLGTPVISSVGMVHADVGSGNSWETIGHMRISPNGKRLALAASQQLNRVELFDFDNTTGVVSNLIFSDENYPNVCGFTGPYGVCFSPDNSKLYISVNVGGCSSSGTEPSAVYQYDLTAGNGAAILASRTEVKTSFTVQFGALQLGPDGKIYLAKLGQQKLDVIQNPNGAGLACDFLADGFSVNTFGGDHTSTLGLPGFVESWLNPTDTFFLSFNGCLQTDTLSFLDTTVVPPYTVSWNFGDPGSGAANTSTFQDPFHLFTSHDVYDVTLSIFMECDTIVVTKAVNTVGSLAVNAGPDTALCIGDSYTIPVGSGNNYSWSPSEGLSCTDCGNPVATPAQTTTYVVNVNAPEPGCAASDSVVITVLANTPLTVSGDTAVCLGAPLHLSASGATQYQWTPAEFLSNDSVSNPVALLSATTTFTLIGSFGSCGADTQTVVVSILDAPDVEAGPDGVVYEGESFQLNAVSDEALFVWSPPQSLSDASIADPTATPEYSTVYTVTVTGENGCTASDSVTVLVIPDEAFVLVPNAFSPNGDGINDELSFFMHNVESFRFQVYNRWGQLLFETDTPGKYWNGVYKRYPQPIGVYVYTVSVTTESGKTIRQHGNVTLLR